ncbi:hypothetical protein [Nocardioides piscis]|uniref:Fibronectin type-III domain-containing protein n=1 Tax=Nocardioides piscis TaxID=2714938 RepID=A0A6G7YDZ3_9ACTN|nr:hypothetical protein [Nocardioides piscis]QIK74858.1 hypothetical protein G7071_04860 [Nocardioides piscis]
MHTRMRRAALSLLALCVAGTAVTGIPGAAAPGDPDPAWGTGDAWVNAPGGVSRQAAFGEVSVVPSVAGEFWSLGVRGDGTKRVLRILRHLNNGTNPPSGAASVVHEVGYVGEASAATSDGAGGAFVAMTRPVGTGWAPVLVHVNANRTLDAGFGQRVLAAAPGYIEHLDIARSSDGTLTVLVKHMDIHLAAVTPMRVLANGSLDASYGAGGVGATQVLGADDDARLGGFTLAPDRSAYFTSSLSPQLRIRKWNPAGGIDAAYGSGSGANPTPSVSFVVVSGSLMLDASGRLLVPYRDFPATGARARIARLLPNGSLDPTFGTGGSTTYDDAAAWDSAELVGLGPASSGNLAAIWFVDPTGPPAGFVTKVLFDSAGSFVVKEDEPACTTRPEDVLVSYPSFVSAATGGAFEVWCSDSAPAQGSFSNATSRLPVAHGDLEVTSSGRVLVVPEIYDEDTTTDIGVLTPAGQPAVGVGVSGFIDTVFGAGTDFPYQDTSSGPGDAFYVRHGLVVGRFTASGVLDPSFSGDGKVTPPGFTQGYAVMALRNGGVMAAGKTAAFPLRLVKYLPNGNLDTSFDGDGIWESAIATGGARKIGEATDGSTYWDLRSSVNKTIRVLPGGGQDMSFGTGGQITISMNDGVVDAAGRLLLTDSDSGTARVRRFTAGGQVDNSFGSGGVVTLTPPVGEDQNPASLTAWPDGSMVVGLTRYPDGGGATKIAWSIVDAAGAVRATRSPGFDHSYAPAAALPDGRVATLDLSDRRSRVFGSKGLAPAVPSLTAVATGPTTARLTAAGDGAGLTGVTLGSEVGLPTDYGSLVRDPIGATTGQQLQVRELTGLAPGTTYNARAVITNASGTTVGANIAFTTPAAAGAGPGELSKNPTVTIKLPPKAKRTSIRAWRVVKGTAAPAVATPTVKIAKVEVNLVRRITKKKCAVYTGKAWKKTTCKKAAKRWVKVKGTTAWKLKVKGLVRGKHTIRARAVDRAKRKSVAVAGVNQVRFKLKRR